MFTGNCQAERVFPFDGCDLTLAMNYRYAKDVGVFWQSEIKNVKPVILVFGKDTYRKHEINTE
jgi:hypothetical protein